MLLDALMAFLSLTEDVVNVLKCDSLNESYARGSE